MATPLNQPKTNEQAKSDAKEFVSRTIKQKVLSREQGEGMGARVRRSIGRPELRNFDPFLMLDEFKVGKPAGFPDHPHRGFETVTYMLPTTKGSFAHEDFCGHKGIIGPGDLQWMTAGKGIVHSEMPANEDISHGLQLWVNLAKKDKLCEPAYQELKASDVPKVTKDGVTAIVIAGEALGVQSKVYTRTPTHYLHFIMEKNSVLNQPIPEGWNAFAYVSLRFVFVLLLVCCVYSLQSQLTSDQPSQPQHHRLLKERLTLAAPMKMLVWILITLWC